MDQLQGAGGGGGDLAAREVGTHKAKAEKTHEARAVA